MLVKYTLSELGMRKLLSTLSEILKPALLEERALSQYINWAIDQAVYHPDGLLHLEIPSSDTLSKNPVTIDFVNEDYEWRDDGEPEE